ncbi:hypothetical protein D3C76_632760 [compost metagenome]
MVQLVDHLAQRAGIEYQAPTAPRREVGHLDRLRCALAGTTPAIVEGLPFPDFGNRLGGAVTVANLHRMLGHRHAHAVVLAEHIEAGAQRADAPFPRAHVEGAIPVGGDLHVQLASVQAYFAFTSGQTHIDAGRGRQLHARAIGQLHYPPLGNRRAVVGEPAVLPAVATQQQRQAQRSDGSHLQPPGSRFARRRIGHGQAAPDPLGLACRQSMGFVGRLPALEGGPVVRGLSAGMQLHDPGQRLFQARVERSVQVLGGDSGLLIRHGSLMDRCSMMKTFRQPGSTVPHGSSRQRRAQCRSACMMYLETMLAETPSR